MMRTHATVALELGASVSKLAAAAHGGEDLRERIRAAVQAWLDEMNLPVDARVQLLPVDRPQGPRFIDAAVLLDGIRCGFGRRQLAQAYESSTSGELADEAAGIEAARDLLARAAAKGGDTLASTHDLLGELVVEAIRTSAERVITPEAAEAVLARAWKEGAVARSAVRVLDRDLAMRVLRRLTSGHVPVQDASAFARSIAVGQADGLFAAEIAERLIDRWRPRSVEIHVDPALAARLLQDDPVAGQMYPPTALAEEPAGMLGLMCDGLFYELGVWFAHFSLVPDPELPPNCCQVRLNQRLTPVLRGLAADEMLVNETPERLTAQNVLEVRPRANPANGNPCAIVPTRYLQQLQPGYTTWDQFGYIVLLLSTELRLAASSLLSLADVEDLLGKLNTAFPALVAASLSRYSPLEVAQVLRRLLRDGVSVRDLRSVLEHLLDFFYTTGVRSPTAGWGGREPYLYVGAEELTGEPYFTADEPYVAHFDTDAMQLWAEPAPEWLADGRIHAEFVKRAMRQYVTHKVSRGQNTIICQMVDAEIEKRFLAFRAAPAGEAPFSEPELGEILEALGKGIEGGYGTPVLFLASTPDVALLIQEMIGSDFPEVIILHRQLIDESANVLPIAVVPGRKTAEAIR